MQWSFTNFGLPLLSRELTELSARKRTFIVRTIYAVIIYSVASWSFWEWQSTLRPNSFDGLGSGQPFFLQLVRWQFWGVYLSLPLLTCGTITAEKERQTLQLLRLTKLGSWTILFEKLGSRLFAMGTFLLLPLPLAAVAYSMGGVDTSDILKSIYVLTITSLQIGSFSLLCSAWFRTSTGAMMGAYLIGAAGMFFGSWLLRLVLLGALQIGVLNLPWPGMTDYGREWLAASVQSNEDYQPLAGTWVFGYRSTENYNFFANVSYSRSYRRRSFPNYQMTVNVQRTDSLPPSVRLWLSNFVNTRVVPASLSDAIICSIPLVISAMVCLALARYVLWRRAEPGEWRLLKSLLALTDRFFQRLNRNRFTRGVELQKVERDLPGDRPIAWRETRYSLIGRFHHLVRLLVLIEIGLVAWLVWQGIFHPILLSARLPVAWMILWFMAALVVVVVSTGLVPLERSRQTFDIVLTTPMTASAIVVQKLAGVRRMIVIVAIPLLTLLAFQLFWGWYVIQPAFNGGIERGTGLTGNEVLIGLARAAAVPAYLSLIGWFGFQCGLRMKNQQRAVLFMLAIVAIACIVPAALPLVLHAVGSHFEARTQWFLDTSAMLSGWLGPCWLLFQNDLASQLELPSNLTIDLFPSSWLPLLFHFSIIGGMLFQVRRNALRCFSRLVNRMEPARQRHVPSVVRQEVPVLDFQSAIAPRNSDGFLDGENQTIHR